MTAPANLEADTTGALGWRSRAATWRKRRRMFESVVDRPEMWLTNEQCWFLIRLTCVLATEVCLITSGLKEPFNAWGVFFKFI